jgi:tryptophan synthase alpha chain
MGYANPFFCWGAERAVAASRTAGVDGWIVPDVPTEEANLFTRHLTPAGVAWIPLVAPTTDVHRAQMIVATLRPPFVYYVSVTGVTGARSEFPAAWAAPLDAMRAQCAAPFVVGFGISSVALAREAAAHSDGVVVGSALIDRLASDGTDGPARVAEFLAELRAVV